MRTLRLLFGVLSIIVLSAIGGLYFLLRASLPQLEGRVDAHGLRDTVSIERDALGTPTVRAGTRDDLAFGTGFVHAQDRFFQMDLQRRAAAGELAELLGSSLVATDMRLRPHGFRRVAEQVLQRAPREHRAILTAYAAGVNAGLRSLRSRPWEYWMLRSEPREWRPIDSVLVAFSMYMDLNDSSGDADLLRTQLRAGLPAALFDFIHPIGTEWDSAIDGGMWRSPAIPGPDVFDLRSGAAEKAALALPVGARTEPREAPAIGSNAWAVAGAQTASGSALLANDMHLGLRTPNVWYRARLVIPGGQEARDLVGLTLPGLPLLIAGSNGHVAWGLTNSYGDWTDLVLVDADPANPQRYVGSAGSTPYELRREVLHVRDGAPVTIDTRWTEWGPIVLEDASGRRLALSWTAHHPEATNFVMLELEQARSAQAAVEVANRAGTPVVNFVAADARGHIAWTIMGRMPVRAGYDSRFVASWRAPDTGWVGWRTPAEYPRVVDPATGRIWSANSRTIDANVWLPLLGDGGYYLGARGAQIRDALFAIKSATTGDMLQVQLDDRALFLARWRDLLLELLSDAAELDASIYSEARALVEQWSGRASVDDVGYRLVRAYRAQVQSRVFESLTASVPLLNGHRFEPAAQFEGALWQLVTQRPEHLLDPRYASWQQALVDDFKRTVDEMLQTCPRLEECTWGERNRLAMKHPLSGAMPQLARWLDMPVEPLPGDADMPRVQGPSFGASERLVVAPGREAEGVLQTPGGASGHPLSSFYRSTHAAWTSGKPQPLLPGATAHRLALVPVPVQR
jgi:penicillin amidase